MATPCAARSHFQLMKMAPITAMSAPGILPVMSLSPRIVPSTPAETATVVQLIWPRFCSVEISLPIVLVKSWLPIVTPVPSGMPSMPPTWPQATWMPTPVRNPMSTVRDRKSARKPSRTSRATIRNTPVISASSAGERDVLRAYRAAARPASPAAITAAVAESAPTTRWRDDPKIAKASIGSRIV